MINAKSLLVQSIVAITMFVMVLDFFFVDSTVQYAAKSLGDFVIPISAVAMTLGGMVLALYYAGRIRKKSQYWQYHVFGIAAMLTTIVVGLLPPVEVVFNWINITVISTIGISMIAISAFFMLSAAYRGLRLGTVESTLMLLGAFFVTLGNAPISGTIWEGSQAVLAWIMDVPNVAGMRGVNIAVGLGVFLVALRMLLGREKSVFGD